MEKQKQLLAAIEAAERDALRIYNSGVKISGVVQHLRGAAKELGARVRSLERETKPKPAAPAAKAKEVKTTTPPAPQPVTE